jgi:SAM-dependent methyltransferase
MASLTSGGMNEDHARLCGSREWAEYLQRDVIAPLLADVDLGARGIEAGPGYGAATDWLRRRVDQLVAVDSDPARVAELKEQLAGNNVDFVHGDASALPYEDGSFDSAATFTMLHHIPTRAGQRQVIAELMRVLRPGGVLVGSDSLASDELREFHAGDDYNPLPPPELLSWLQELGGRTITLIIADTLAFTARKP